VNPKKPYPHSSCNFFFFSHTCPTYFAIHQDVKSSFDADQKRPKTPHSSSYEFLLLCHTCPRIIITYSNDQEEQHKLFSSKSSARQTSEACLDTSPKKSKKWKTFASEEEEEEQRKCKTRTWSEIMMAKENMENNIPKEEIAEENGRDWSFDWIFFFFFFFFYGTMVRVLGP
jgi:hypothetical protein